MKRWRATGRETSDANFKVKLNILLLSSGDAVAYEHNKLVFKISRATRYALRSS